MKKIFSIFASSVLALSMFVSCSGDLHNDMDPAKVALLMGETKTILDDADICGTVNDWAGAALTKVDDTTYTYTFTADETDEQFSIREVAGSWTAGKRWCGALKKDEDNAVKIEPKGEAAMIYSDDPDPSHFKLTKLTVGTGYKITVTIVDEDKKSLKASVAVDGDAPAAGPVPFYLDDAYFFLGDYDGWAGHNVANMFTQDSFDKQSGDVIYKVVVEATEDGTQFGIPALKGIGGDKWATAYKNAEVTVDGGWTKLTKYVDEKDADGNEGKNATVKGMTAGSKYNVYLKTTEKKEVSVKIDVVPAFNYIAGIAVVGLDATNFADGTKVLFNCDYPSWGAWDDTNKNTSVVSNGVAAAKFAEAIKIEKNKDASKNQGKTIIELCNVGLNAEGKPDWNNKKLCTKYRENSDNAVLEITEAQLDGGNYMIFADLTGVAAGDAISWKLVKVKTTDVMFVAGATGLPAEANGKVVYMTGGHIDWAKPGENNYTAAVKIADGKVFSVGFCAAEEIQFKFAGKGWTLPEVVINQADNNNIVVTISKEKHTVIGTYASTVATEKYGCNWEVK